MDAGTVLQENVYKTFKQKNHQLECSQMDGLAGAEDDLQVGIANQHLGSSRFDQTSPTILCDKE